jgi:flavodoxin
MEMKSLVIVLSIHHNNTVKVADVLARVLDAQIRRPQEVEPQELEAYDLVGFGSGIYGERHHRALFDLADRLPQVANRKAFIFSTCGIPAFGMTDEVVAQNHARLREKLQSRGFVIVDEFGCVGYNTNSFLKLFGGINKGRPNPQDLERAEAFAQKLMRAENGP